MDCGIWIVPVLAIVVWIITSLLKGSEEKPEARRRPDGEERAQPPVELDKFLAEVRRRKQGSAAPRDRPREVITEVVPAEPVRPSVVDRPPPGQLSAPPLPRPRPAPPPPAPRQPPPAPRRPTPEPSARRERPPARRLPPPQRIPLAAPVDVVVPLDVIPVEPVRLSDVALGSAEVGQAGTVHKVKQTPRQAQLAALLRSPQDLRNAIILQEVFSPPLCMRRHR